MKTEKLSERAESRKYCLKLLKRHCLFESIRKRVEEREQPQNDQILKREKESLRDLKIKNTSSIEYY